MRNGGSFFWMVAAACVLMAATAAQAQAAPETDGWQYEFDVFAWGSSLSGDVGPASDEYRFHQSFSDVLNYLDIAAMGHFDARKDRWGFMVDAFYVNLGDTKDTSYGIPVKINLEESIFSVVGTYRAFESPKASFDVTMGARYNEIKSDLTPRDMPRMHSSFSWTDPIVGFKGGVKLGKIWTFGYRGDVGGFGAGSDFTWLGVLRFDARVSKNTTLGFGYSGYNVDYTEGSGAEEFVYNVTTYGPFLGVAFRW